MNTPRARFLDFGSFRVDTQRRLLLRDGVPVPLGAKTFQMLLLLVQYSGTIVSKEKFLSHIWPDSFVEENILAQNIFILRKILGEGKDEHRYIATIPNSGYSFVASVNATDEDSDKGSSPRQKQQGIAGLTKATEEVGAETSIAVLPFKTLRKDEEDTHLRIGLADALIRRLTGLRYLTVRPTTSVLRYADSPQDILIAGRELGVDFLLDGLFQRSGDLIRVSAQLVRVRNGATLWGAKFDEQFGNIFELEDSISEQVVAALELKLSQADRDHLTNPQAINLEAHELYLMGLYFWTKRSKANLAKAIEYLQRAIALDPDYALAYALLSDTYALIVCNHYDILPPSEAREKSKAAAARALELNDRLAEAHLALAMVSTHEGDREGVERSLKRALALEPDSPTAHHRYGWHLAWKGELLEAIAQMKRAQELDPLSPAINSALSGLLIYARSYDEAIKYSQRAAEISPGYCDTFMNLGDAYELKGMYSEALKEFEKASESDDGNTEPLAGIGHVFVLSGRRQEAREVLARLKNSSVEKKLRHYSIALIYTALDQREEAFKWLDRAIGTQSIDPTRLRFDPKLEPLRSDPRYEEILRRHHLERLLG